MAVIQSLGALTDIELGWSPLYTYSSLSLYDGLAYDYAALYRTQPNVRICVDFLARNVAQLGLHVFRRLGEDRERLRDHPLAQVLEQPLPADYKVTRYRLIESLMADLGIYFNAFWLKVRNQGQLCLLRVPPTLVTITGGLVPTEYEISLGSSVLKVQPAGIVHFRGYNAENAIWGLSPLETLRRTLAEEEAMGDYREHFWQNAARMGGVIERPAESSTAGWSDAARERFKKEWEQLYAGGENSGKTAILEEGMTWKQITFNAEESQYLESRKLTSEECARSYHIPLPMVGILENATFSNIQEQHRNLYQDSLGPWCAMIEQEIALQLLPEFDDTQGVYVEFNISEKLQGSFEAQTQALQASVGRPWMTANEARARMNLPMLPDGNDLVTPLNVLTGGLASPQDTADKARAEVKASWQFEPARTPGPLDPTRPALRAEHEAEWAERMAKYFRRQERTLVSRMPKGQRKSVDEIWSDPERWDKELTQEMLLLNQYTALEWARWSAQRLGGEVDPAGMDEYLLEVAQNAATNINAASREKVTAALREEQPLQALRDLYLVFATSRAAEIARSKVTEMANFGSHEAARACRVLTKTWQVNSTNPRDEHMAVNGETVGIGQRFSNGMRWPGDPAGGADNVAGCQCSVRFNR